MLISDEYRDLNRRLHESRSTYGTSGHKWAGIVTALTSLVGTTDVLDYGCGKSTLAKSLGFSIKEYDPAIAGKDQMPVAADIVVCTDVLEHIEPAHLMSVLKHICKLSQGCALLVASTRKAKKKLPDGRNAHLIVENEAWWAERLNEYFDLIPLCSDTDDESVWIAIPRRP